MTEALEKIAEVNALIDEHEAEIKEIRAKIANLEDARAGWLVALRSSVEHANKILMIYETTGDTHDE